MPVHESEAIVLRSFSLGEADRIVSFLSRSQGRIRGVAKGARRTRSRFGSTLEMLSHVRIWTYERETRDLVRITQCELLESFLDLQGAYDTSVAASLIAEISEAVLPEKEASDAAFRLLLVTARALKQTKRPAVPLAYFGLWTLRLAGWLPAIDQCVKCGKIFADAAAYGSSASPGLLCGNCKRGVSRTMSPATRALARRFLTEKLEALALDPALDATAQSVNGWALDVIEQQIEKQLNSRAMMETTG